MTATQSNFVQLKDFLSYLATVQGDLSNITAPPFVLSPKSVTEIPASWAEHNALFLQPCKEEDPAKRALLVLKNFLCSLKRQLYTAADDDSEGGAKKPLNAFLGELFLGSFEGGGSSGSSTRLIAEQVSHHPPVTACFLYNKEHGISSTGYVAQETTFNATSGIQVQQVGYAIIRDERHGESHLMTLPTMAIKGLLTGKPYPELSGTCYIASSSGYLAVIKFVGKKALGMAGKKNSVTAELTAIREGGKRLFEIEGQWNERLTVTDCIAETTVETFEVDEVPCSQLTVAPVEEQSPWESRRAWRQVVAGINAGDMGVVSKEKDKIEDAQRQMRTAEHQAKIEWPRVFFQQQQEDKEFKVLANAIPEPSAKTLDQGRTAGVWKFIGIGAAEALIREGIFHRSLEPTGQVLKEGQQNK